MVARGSRHPARPLGLKARPRPAKARCATGSGGEAATPGLAVRLTATSILRQVIELRIPLDSILDEATGNPHFRALNVRDRGLCRAIVGIALRRRSEIE